MKRTILLTFLTLLIFSITGCKDSSSEKTDADIIPDTDITVDYDTAQDKDISRPDEQPSIDEDIMPSEEDDEFEYPDEDGYPYYDDKGNIHFCNEGDIQTEKDPQCITNLWKEDNQEFCTKFPEYDCCGYPCEMPNLLPVYRSNDNIMTREIGICDVRANPMFLSGGNYRIKWFNFSEGKLVFKVDSVETGTENYINNFRILEYDVPTKKYRFVSPASLNIAAYHKGKYLGAANRIPYGEPYRDFLLYTDEKDRMITVYPKPIRFITWNAVIGDKWAFANIEERDEDPSYMKYAKIVEKTGTSYENLTWNWISLGTELAYNPNIVDNKLAFYLDNFKGYLCDLDTSPKSLDDCKLVNRTADGADEKIRHLIIDENNKDILYFNPLEMTDGFMRIDTSKTPWEYTKFEVQDNEPNTYSLVMTQIKDSFITYLNIYLPDGTIDSRTGKLCFYRLDKKKSYCSKPVTWIDAETGKEESKYDQSHAESWGHYLAWQDAGSPYLFLRDMECYCDHYPEVCPYDDYTPNPECPKNIKTGEHECGDDNETPDDEISDADAM